MVVLLFVLSIVLLITMITKLRIHAFLSLIVVALLLGLAAGLSPADAASIVAKGFGGIMSYIGIVIVCGVVIGEFLEITGGAQKIANSILSVVGAKRSTTATALTGAVVSIPVFCDSGFVILNPIIKSLSMIGKIPYMSLVIALMGGLLVTHSFIPPTPGPIAASAILGADLGKVMIYGFIAAVPVIIVLILWAKSSFIQKKYPDLATISREEKEEEDAFQKVVAKAPSTFMSFMPIVVPIILIVLSSFTKRSIDQETGLATIINFLGTPFVALLIGTGFSFLLPKPLTGEATEGWVGTALQKSAEILLITAAAGSFGKVLQAIQVGDVMAGALTSMHLPMIIVPFLLSSIVLIAQGSATVALTTTSAIVAPLLPKIGLSPEMAVLAIAAGSLTGVQANGSYFWAVVKLAGLDIKKGYVAVTLSTVIMGLTAFATVLLMSLILP